jgi:phosphoenolpyruvate synthase/pyruvate phosphate dikinase
MTFGEIIETAKTGKIVITPAQLTGRKEFYASVLLKGKYSVESGKKNIKKFRFMDSYKPVMGEKVKGVTAFAGKVKGLVKIVRTDGDLDKVRRGDIMVAVMTFPNFIPAMEKASAFVTDEGGILCHAAIISREMKKPCIIATKNATKILKDGDMVEVDANKGIVKILK